MERMGRATKKVKLRRKQRGNVGSERVSKSVATLSDSHRKPLMIQTLAARLAVHVEILTRVGMLAPKAFGGHRSAMSLPTDGVASAIRAFLFS